MLQGAVAEHMLRFQELLVAPAAAKLGKCKQPQVRGATKSLHWESPVLAAQSEEAAADPWPRECGVHGRHLQQAKHTDQTDIARMDFHSHQASCIHNYMCTPWNLL